MTSKMVALSKKPFIRNVVIMATGTAAAQAIYILLAPLITRLYGPEAFGLMGTFMAIVGLLAPVAALAYPIAIVLPEKEETAKKIVKISILISIFIAILISLVLFFSDDKIIHTFNLESVSEFLFLIPIVIILSSFLQVIENWMIRTKEFKTTAKANLIHALVFRGGMVILGFLSPTASVLLITTTLGDGIKALITFFLLKKKKNTSKKTEIDRVSFKEILIQYRDFPLFRTPQIFIFAISQSMPVLLLANFFGPSAAGFYTIGRTVLNIPTQLIGKSVGDVFYPRISEAAKNKESLTPLIKKATISLAIVGVLPFMVIVVGGPWIFGLVFGLEWTRAGEYASWSAVLSFFNFLNKPSLMALPVLSAQAFHLKYTFFMLIVLSISLIIGYYLFSSDLVAVALYSITGGVLNLILIFKTIRLSKSYDNLN